MPTAPTGKAAGPQKRQPLADAARAVALANIQNPDYSLTDAANDIGTTRRTLQRALTEAGTTWRELITAARLDTAEHRILEGTTPIAHIAIEVGYGSHRNFNKAFRRRHGIAPSEYAARHH